MAGLVKWLGGLRVVSRYTYLTDYLTQAYPPPLSAQATLGCQNQLVCA